MELNIINQDGENSGRFYATLDATHEAEMTYVKIEPGLRACDHTGVPAPFEGQGVAFQLLEALVKDARENELKYIPICPYVVVQFRRHPEWADVFVTP